MAKKPTAGIDETQLSPEDIGQIGIYQSNYYNLFRQGTFDDADRLLKQTQEGTTNYIPPEILRIARADGRLGEGTRTTIETVLNSLAGEPQKPAFVEEGGDGNKDDDQGGPGGQSKPPKGSDGDYNGDEPEAIIRAIVSDPHDNFFDGFEAGPDKTRIQTIDNLLHTTGVPHSGEKWTGIMVCSAGIDYLTEYIDERIKAAGSKPAERHYQLGHNLLTPIEQAVGCVLENDYVIPYDGIRNDSIDKLAETLERYLAAIANGQTGKTDTQNGIHASIVVRAVANYTTVLHQWLLKPDAVLGIEDKPASTAKEGVGKHIETLRGEIKRLTKRDPSFYEDATDYSPSKIRDINQQSYEAKIDENVFYSSAARLVNDFDEYRHALAIVKAEQDRAKGIEMPAYHIRRSIKLPESNEEISTAEAIKLTQEVIHQYDLWRSEYARSLQRLAKEFGQIKELDNKSVFWSRMSGLSGKARGILDERKAVLKESHESVEPIIAELFKEDVKSSNIKNHYIKAVREAYAPATPAKS